MRPWSPAVLLGLWVWAALGCATSRLPPLSESGAGPAKKAAAGQEQGKGAADKRLQPFAEDRPMAVTSDRLNYLEQGKVTVFLGHVKVRQESMRLEAPYLEVRSSDNRAHAQDGVLVVDQARNLTLTAQELDYQENLYNATAKGKVCVDSQDERGQPFRICSERLDWNVRQKLMHAQGKVRVTYAGTTATAEDLDYRQDAQIAVLKPGAGAKSPRPTISQADSVILGDELTLHLRERMYEAKGSAWGKIILRAKEQP